MLAVAGTAFAAPAGAGAATFTLTNDANAGLPDIAVDADGTSHIVWEQRVQGGDKAHEDVAYCRIPRGAQACASARLFNFMGIAEQPRVMLMPTGELVIVSARFGHNPTGGFDDAQSRAYAITSTDGGATFGEPRLIADRGGTIHGWAGEVEPGPGNFSVSLTGTADGSCSVAPVFTTAPLDGFTEGSASLADRCGFYASIAFIDPVTPLVAHTEDDQIYYRRWGGAGDYNDASTWMPEQTASFGGSETRLAGGLRGVYLMFRDDEPPFDYRVSRYDRDSGAFGAPRIVSADDRETAIFGDFIQDAGGTLHAAFLEPPSTSKPRQLRHAVSRDGQTWGRFEVLARDDQLPENESFFNLRLGAAPDGGGAIVSDNNGRGPIRFTPFAPGGGETTGCPATVKLGIAVVRALEGCFKKKGGARVATGPVKLNGVDIGPAADGASAAAAFKVTADPKARTLETNAKAAVEVGNVTLDRSKIAWKLPSGTGAVKRLGAADTTAFNNLANYAKQLFEFPVKGDAELLIGTGETARIPTNFGLPNLLGGVSGAVTLNTTAAGFNPAKLEITAPAADIGLLRIGNIKVSYAGQNRFIGSATLSLPPAYGSPFNVGFGFENGRLHFVHYDMPFQPMLPIVAPPVVGTPPEPLVGLERLAIDYVNESGSRKFIGSVDLVGGGKYFGVRAAALDGSVTLEFPGSGPATITAQGDLSVVTVPFASGSISYSTDGLLDFNGQFAFPPPGKWSGIAGVEGFVNGWVSVTPPIRFSAHGGASAHVGPASGSGEAVISSEGVTGCVSFPQPPPPADFIPDIGVSYKWGAAYPTPTCNVGSFKLAKPASASAVATTTVQIPGGLPQAALEISGAGGAPRVKVTAPDGSSVTSEAQPVMSGRFIATEFAEAQKTYVQIGEPPAGGYTIEAQPESVQIAEARLAAGLPDPRVRAKVTGTGRTRKLHYSMRRIGGQRVTFAEQSGGGLYREFARTKKARGKVTFRPVESRQRRRRIVALVEQNGLPRARLDLARYTAPKPRRAAKPRKLRVRRKGAKLVAKWRKVRGASGYKVRIVLPKDGRRIVRHLKPKRHRISLGGIEANDRGSISVQAVGRDARPGRAAKAKLKPRRSRKGRR